MTLRKKIIDLFQRNPVSFTPMEVFLKLENEPYFAAVADELHKLEKEGRLVLEYRRPDSTAAYFTYRNDGAA